MSIKAAPTPNAAGYDKVSASRPATSGPMIAPISEHIEKNAKPFQHDFLLHHRRLRREQCPRRPRRRHRGKARR